MVGTMATVLKLPFDSLRARGWDRKSHGTIGLMSYSHFALEGCHHFLPVIVPLLVTGLGVDYAQIGALTFVALSVTAGTQPCFGWLADRWQPALIIPLSIVWVGLCMALSGVMPAFVWLGVVVVAASLGSAAFHPAAAAVALSVSSRNPGTMFSVFSLGGTLGVAVSPLLINYLLPVWGLPATLLYLPLAVVSAVAVFWGLRTLAPATEGARRSDGHSAAARPNPIPRTIVALLGFLVLATMTRSWVFGAVSTYGPAWVLEKFGDPTLGGEMLALAALMGAVGNLVGGYAADRFPGWKILACALAVIALVLWTVVRAPFWGLLPCVGVFGFAMGVTLPVPVLLARRLIPTRTGLAAALVMGLGWVPSGIGAGAVGWAADRFGLQAALEPMFLYPLAGVGIIVLFAWLARTWDVPVLRTAGA